jgi:hypothetical protein
VEVVREVAERLRRVAEPMQQQHTTPAVTRIEADRCGSGNDTVRPRAAVRLHPALTAPSRDGSHEERAEDEG